MALRQTCEGIYCALRRRLVPRLRHSQDAYAELLRRHVNRSIDWLDLGCGHGVLPDWHAETEQLLVRSCRMVAGVDAELSSLRNHRTIRLKVNGEIAQLPFRDACFDLVTANMVVEHLDSPGRDFREIGRVLRPGGLFILLTPNAYGYPTILARCIPHAWKRRLVHLLDGRREEDVFRAYYRANTRKRLKVLADASSLEVVQIATVATDALAAVVPPLAALELVWIKLLMTRPFHHLRPSMLATLRKLPGGARATASHAAEGRVPAAAFSEDRPSRPGVAAE